MYAVATQKRRNGTSIIMYTYASGAKKSHTKSFNSLDAGLSSVILPLFECLFGRKKTKIKGMKGGGGGTTTLVFWDQEPGQAETA